jgi:hypothetical protein
MAARAGVMMGATNPVWSWGNVNTVTNRQRRRIVRAIEKRTWLAEALADCGEEE